MDDFKQQVTASIAKVAPPAGVSMWITFGQHLDDWIKLATLVYIICQVTALVVTKYLQWTGQLKGKVDDNPEI